MSSITAVELLHHLILDGDEVSYHSDIVITAQAVLPLTSQHNQLITDNTELGALEKMVLFSVIITLLVCVNL